MNRFILRLISVTFVLLCICASVHAEDTAALPDSLLTRDHIYEYTFSDTVKAASIITAMRERRLAPVHELDIAQGDLLYNNGRYRAALPYYSRALQSDSVKADSNGYMDMLHRMVSCYDSLHDEKMKARYVEMLLEKAEECGSKAMQSVALFNMGKAVYYQESKERGYDMIKEAVSLMEESDYVYKYDNLRYNYNTLFIMQQNDGYWEDALETLGHLEKVISAGTGQEPDIMSLEDKELKTLYANRAVTLMHLGRDSEADEAYRLWKKAAPFYTKDDYLIAPYLSGRKMYDEVIRIYTSLEGFLRTQKDTVNYHMRTVKRALGNAYSSKHDYRRAAVRYHELAVLTDSLKVREQKSAALELAEVYRTNEQAAQLKEQENAIRVRSLVILFSAVLLAVALAAVVLVLRDKRIIQRKNEAMAVTIDKLMAYKKELFIRQEEAIRLRDGLEPAVNESGGLTEDDRGLYDRMVHEIVSRKLYLNPDFNKNGLMKEIHVPSYKFAALFREFAGCSFSQYIQECRLDYAVSLMNEHPKWSMEYVAEASGMSKSAFYQQFQKKYGMNPSCYRKK